MDWFKNKLLPNVQQKSLIIMINVSYHKARPQSTSKPGRMKKSEILLALDKYGIFCDPEITAIETRLKLREWIKNSITMEVVQATR